MGLGVTAHSQPAFASSPVDCYQFNTYSQELQAAFSRASAARYPVNDRRASASGNSAPGKLADMICFFPLFAVY